MNIRSYIKSGKLFGYEGANNVRFSLNKCLYIICGLFFCNHNNSVKECLEHIFIKNGIYVDDYFIMNFVIWMEDEQGNLTYFYKPATYRALYSTKIKKLCVNSVMCSIISRAHQMGLISFDEMASWIMQFEFRNETIEEKEVRMTYSPSMSGWAAWNTNGSGYVRFICTPMYS